MRVPFGWESVELPDQGSTVDEPCPVLFPVQELPDERLELRVADVWLREWYS